VSDVYTVNMKTRERILAAARDLFLEHGPEGVGMRAVAGRVGLTPMALYRHFRSKEALHDALIEQGHTVFLQYLQRALAEPSAGGRLARAGFEYLNFALEHRQDYRMMFMMASAPRGSDSGGPAWRDVATFRFLVDRIRETAAAGLLDIDDPESTALSVWAHVHGLVSLYLTNKLELDEAQFRDLYARSVTGLMLACGWPREPEMLAAAAP
jgi:AcrR family transcriptional regulator